MTLTLHRLGLAAGLGASFRTINVLESIMARVEQRTTEVDHWRTSNQNQRWCAAALLELKTRIRKVKGYLQWPQLMAALCSAQTTPRDAARVSLAEEPSDF